MFKKILYGIFAILGLVLTLGSEDSFQTTLANNEGDSSESNGESIELAYVLWETETASTNVIAEVLRREGYNVTLTPLDNAIMWSSVASGDADAMVAGWLPNTHSQQYERYGDQIEHLGVNMEGAKTGLTVPTYMDVDSIADLTNEAGQVITGIEPGAGIMLASENLPEAYPNLADWELQSSSEGAMVTTLDQAIANQEEIVVTGWSPHWKFQEYDLKYLEDPEGVYGGAETINTFVRLGFQEDHPRAYEILSRFYWDIEDMESVMVAINNGQAPEEAAKDWVDKNPDKVNEWLGQ